MGRQKSAQPTPIPLSFRDSGPLVEQRVAQKREATGGIQCLRTRSCADWCGHDVSPMVFSWFKTSGPEREAVSRHQDCEAILVRNRPALTRIRRRKQHRPGRAGLTKWRPAMTECVWHRTELTPGKTE